MPIFVCSKCGMMENTAACFYWTRKKEEPALCSACDPKIGKWHRIFEREKPPSGYIIGPDGFLYHSDDPLLKRQQGSQIGARSSRGRAPGS